MNIGLIGFMGTGKSTIGRKLATEINYNFVDLDTEIARKDNRSIDQIFSAEGEDYFRKLEMEVTKEISSRDEQVIATGGGVVLNRENIRSLKNNGILILLKATPQQIYERIKNDNSRPLLQVTEPVEEIKDLLKRREDKYNCTPYQIDTNSLTVDEVVAKILKTLYNLKEGKIGVIK